MISNCDKLFYSLTTSTLESGLESVLTFVLCAFYTLLDI